MDNQFSTNSDVIFETNIQEPKKYQVVLLNDDYTTKEFVVEILTNIFYIDISEAVILMEKVHSKGQAVVGVYPYDIANTKATLAIQLARKNGFPLQCLLQEE